MNAEHKVVIDTKDAQLSLEQLIALARELSTLIDGPLNVQRMVVQPTDTIVLKTPNYLSGGHRQALIDYATGMFRHDRIIVLDGGMDVLVAGAVEGGASKV